MTKIASIDGPEGVTAQKLSFDKEFLKDVPKFLRGAPDPDDTDPDEDNDRDRDNDEDDDHPVDDSPKKTPLDQAIKPKDLGSMTLEQLRAQQDEIQQKIQEKQKTERQGVIKQIVQVVHDYEVPLEELIEALGGFKNKRIGHKAKAKYVDPATGTTWSGRGKEPTWIRGVADRTPFEVK